MSKPRMVASDKWKERPCVMRYWAWKAEIKSLANERSLDLPSTFRVYFHVPIPPSITKAAKAARAGNPHTQRPDVDNFVKGLLDALCEEDSYVWRVDAQKRWSKNERGEIWIERI